jgi:molecular chaperone DnaK
MPQIEVTFDIDANGILKVTAQDKATGRSQHITITASSGLSESEVEKMRKDAESHAEEDRKRRELIEARNNADNTVYAAEKALREFGEKVPAEIKSEVEAKVAEVKRVAQTEDVASIKSATETLGQVVQKIGAAVYQGPNAPGNDTGGQGPNPNPEPGPDVVEGEVKE